ncbi:MAG: PucR family transcriptional regulator ligand-binding domain-containing protein [Clostridium sp.]|nr:PucR family transcriptional regulator ligand-binding domain-containing protein [Clostridium sp.]
MAISVRNLYELTKDKYNLKLIAGEEGLDNDVRWMYFMEDTEVADFLYGREFVITTGFAMKDEDERWFINLAQKLIARKACGLIFNVGNRINHIPEELIRYCNEMSFPVFTMPWKIHIVDIVKDYCIKIFLSEQSEENISSALNKIIFNYNEAGDYIQSVEDAGFNKDSDYVISLIKAELHESKVEIKEKDNKIIQENIKIAIRDILNREFEHYNIIQKNDIYLITIRCGEMDIVRKCIIHISEKLNHMYKLRTSAGMGSCIKGLKSLNSNYKRAKAALFMAESKGSEIEMFENMGVYRAIFTAENDDILREIYYEKLGSIIEYDKKHNTSLRETLKMYLSSNRSVQSVSDKSYVHRNTVNYRIKKIKEILNCDLEDYDDIFAYELAFFIEKSLEF